MLDVDTNLNKLPTVYAIATTYIREPCRLCAEFAVAPRTRHEGLACCLASRVVWCVIRSLWSDIRQSSVDTELPSHAHRVQHCRCSHIAAHRHTADPHRCSRGSCGRRTDQHRYVYLPQHMGCHCSCSCGDIHTRIPRCVRAREQSNPLQ